MGPDLISHFNERGRPARVTWATAVSNKRYHISETTVWVNFRVHVFHEHLEESTTVVVDQHGFGRQVGIAHPSQPFVTLQQKAKLQYTSA